MFPRLGNTREKVTDCKYMTADVVLDGGFQGFSTDPFAATYSGGNAVGGAPSNSMYMLNVPVTFH